MAGLPLSDPEGAHRVRMAEESDFCFYEWTGQAAAEEFFGLHNDPAFRGTGLTGVVLPPNCYAVSQKPTAGAAVIGAYAHGLEYANQLFSAGTLLLFGALTNGYLTFLLAAELGNVDGIFFLLCVLFCAAGEWLLIRVSITGYRYTPVLFNRASGKVHVFEDRTPFFGFLPLFGGGEFKIHTYDWSCIRAQISRFRISTGNSAQDNARLACVVLNAPDDGKIVSEFPLGVTTSAIAIQSLLDHWEHIRRYMEYEGPMFLDGEGPHREITTRSLFAALFFGQPFIGPGAKAAFEVTDMGASLILVVWQILVLPLFPLTLTLGVLRWASSRIRTEPRWPTEIIASVGGKLLEGAELDAWRNVVPEKPGRTVVHAFAGVDELEAHRDV